MVHALPVQAQHGGFGLGIAEPLAAAGGPWACQTQFGTSNGESGSQPSGHQMAVTL